MLQAAKNLLMRTNRAVITDSGFWIALFDARDGHHRDAQRMFEHIQNVQILFLWPILYEVLRTRFTRRHHWITEFGKIVKSPNLHRLDDTPYRDDALRQMFRPEASRRGISLVDMVVRFALDDRRFRVTNLITFNVADFSDVCRKHRIAMNY